MSVNTKKKNVSKEQHPPPIDPEALAFAQSNMLPEDQCERLVALFETLADSTRIQMLVALHHQPLCVRDLAILTGHSESSISHQLQFLRSRRLVSSRRQGTVIIYSLNDHPVTTCLRMAIAHVP